MTPCCILLFVIVTLFQDIVGLSEERFYHFEFSGQSGWTIQNVGSGLNLNSANAKCPSTSDGYCWEMGSKALARSVISTEGYHTIRILIDVHEASLDADERCYLQYRTNSTFWVNIAVAQKDEELVKNKEIIIPDTPQYNNQQSFEIGIGNSAAGDDWCYFEDLELYGIAYTNNPTAGPTIEPTYTPITPSYMHSSHPTNIATISTVDKMIDKMVDTTTTTFLIVSNHRTDPATTRSIKSIMDDIEDFELILVSVIIIWIFICCACTEYMCNKCNYVLNKCGIYTTDQSNFAVLGITALRIADFITDGGSMYKILTYYMTYPSSSSLCLAIASITAIFIPFILSSVSIYYATDLKATFERPTDWFNQYIIPFILLVCITNDIYISTKLFNSNLFGLELFHSGMTSIEQEKLEIFKIAVIVTENVPQIITQFIFIMFVLKETNILIITSLILSLIASTSALMAFINRRNIHKKCKVFAYQLKLTFSKSADNDQFDKQTEIEKVQKYRGLKDKLRKEIAREINVNSNHLEIGYIALEGSVSVVDIVQTIIGREVDIDVFRHSLEGKLKGIGGTIKEVYRLNCAVDVELVSKNEDEDDVLDNNSAGNRIKTVEMMNHTMKLAPYIALNHNVELIYNEKECEEFRTDDGRIEEMIQNEQLI